MGLRGRSIGLSGVAATSPSNASAVGTRCGTKATQTIIEHWNGKGWKVQPSPNPGGSGNTSVLSGVAATSSTNAWAVGSYDGLADPPLIEQWNGKAWKIQPSSNFPAGALFGVAAVSSSDAWGVGDYYNGTDDQNLILHCC